MDTIFAQATAPGKAGVAIVRISGPDAFRGAARLCGALPEARRAGLCQISDLDGTRLDRALVIAFPDGMSFTGEPVVEFHLHGSLAVVNAVLRTLERLEGFRPAEAGEFTRRALDNQKLDLIQVEALADLIDAETELQRQQAESVMSGALSKKVQVWRAGLVEAAALLEATLDFSDEDVPGDLLPRICERIQTVEEELAVESASFGAAERVRDGFEVAILGPPNAGKSTLLNAIARRSVALTSEIAGTTRDVLELRVDLEGLPVTFLDTAGIRETDDPLESAGIEVAMSRSAAADLRIWLAADGDEGPETCDLQVIAKDDDGSRGGVSGVTGQGVQKLLAELATRLRGRIPRNRHLIRERHRAAVRRAECHLAQAGALLGGGDHIELAALEVRNASAALAEIIGAIDVEDLLEEIFSSFCIGK